MRSIATRTWASITFTEFSTWGGSADNGTEQPRISIKDDLTLVQGVAHDQDAASPSTASRRTASASRISAAGPASASSKRRFRARRRWPTAAAIRSRRSCSARLTPAGPKPSAISSRSIPTTAFYRAGRLAHQREAGAQLRRCATSSRSRRVAGGDQYSDFSPTKPNPAVNNYPGALVFAGDGPGREGTRSLFPGYYGALAPRVSFAYSAERQDDLFAEASADRSDA